MFKAETGCVDVDDDNYLSEESSIDALVPSRIEVEVKRNPSHHGFGLTSRIPPMGIRLIAFVCYAAKTLNMVNHIQQEY